MPRRVGVAWKDVLRVAGRTPGVRGGIVTYPPQDAVRGARKGTCAVHDVRRSGRTALYWVHTPMNRSDVIDPETKSRGATPS